MSFYLFRTCFRTVLRTTTIRQTSMIKSLAQQQNSLTSPLTRHFSHGAILKSQEKLSVTFVRPNGERINASAKEGDQLLDVVLNNNIDIDGFGACEGTLSCSTCHLILKQEDYDGLKEKPTDEELDMLDLAYGLADTSRLGCQVYLTKEMDGLEVQIPEGINDVREET